MPTNIARMKDSRYIRSVAVGAGAFFKRTFRKVHYSAPKVKSRDLKNLAIMPVCTHRSQADYFVLGSFLYRLGVPDVRFAAGDNLTTLPWLGARFQDLGAFPVSREKARHRNYISELCGEVAGLIGKGASVVVFPEGGRSYKGNMMDMRGGMIGAHVMSQWRDPDRTHVFLPAAISYEQLPELLYFDMLEKGRELRKEKGNPVKRVRGSVYYFGADAIAFSKFLMANRLGRNYGDVWVEFGEPVAISDIVDLRELYNKRGRDEFLAHRKSMQAIGLEIGRLFRKLYRLLPMHLVAAVLAENKECSRKEVVDNVSRLMDSISSEIYNTKSLEGLNEGELTLKGVRQLRAMKGIAVRNGRFVIRKPTVIDYYAAAIEKE